jgi:hypothetical protein
MALSTSTLPGQISASRAEETDATSTVNTIGSGTLYLDQVSIDNTANVNDTVYLKLYDSGSSVTVGTNVPDFIFPCSAGESIHFSMEPGGKFSNGIKAAMVLEAGTAGTTSPTSDTKYSLLYHA